MANPILILYGSVAGNSEICAERAAATARQRGYDPVIESMASTEPEVLTQFPIALIITSTYGDGDPPDGTEDFHEAVVNAKRVLLTRLRYSVLALGDSCYDQFCRCGRDYDDALEKLGGVRIYPRAECDTDYDDIAERWTEGVFSAWRRNARSWPPERMETHFDPHHGKHQRRTAHRLQLPAGNFRHHAHEARILEHRRGGRFRARAA